MKILKELKVAPCPRTKAKTCECEEVKTISEAEQSAPNPFELFMCVMGIVTIFLIASLLFLDREGEFYKLISYSI